MEKHPALFGFLEISKMMVENDNSSQRLIDWSTKKIAFFEVEWNKIKNRISECGVLTIY